MGDPLSLLKNLSEVRPYLAQIGRMGDPLKKARFNHFINEWPALNSKICVQIFDQDSYDSFYEEFIPRMFYIYILKSLKDDKTYVGYTNNLDRRIAEHNSGKNLATKNRIPLELLFYENFETSQEARKRELYWKNGGGRRKLKEFFKNGFPSQA